MSDHPPLRTVLLYSTGHLGSAIVLNLMLKMPEFDIVGIVRATSIPSDKEGKKALKKHLHKIGWKFGWMLFWQRIIQMISYILSIILPFSNKKRFLPGWWLAREHNIPTLQCENINDDKSMTFIESLKPDLIVSAYFNQILKAHIIRIPKHGVLNIHPGILPLYRGAMSYFWVLKNHEDKGGVSVHWIDEGIDTGALVAQKTFTVHQGTTQHQVLVQTAVIGSTLLQQTARKLLEGKAIEKLEVDEQDANYYSMPKAKDFEEYMRHRRFFRIRNVFNTIIGGKKHKKS